MSTTRTRLTEPEVTTIQGLLKPAMVALDACGQDDLADQVKAIFKEVAARMYGQSVHEPSDVSVTIVCTRCGRTTTDPDRWDPEADTGRIYCDACWPHRRDDEVRS